MQPVVWLLLAIGSEVVATSALKASDGFTRLVPAVVVVVGYAASFYFLALTLRDIPLGRHLRGVVRASGPPRSRSSGSYSSAKRWGGSALPASP